MTAAHIFDDLDAVHTVIHAHCQASASDSKHVAHKNKQRSCLELDKQNNAIEEDYYLSDTLSSSDQSTFSNTSRGSIAASDDISLASEDCDGINTADKESAICNDSNELNSQVQILRITYLLVTLVIMLADGLQGEKNRLLLGDGAK